MKQPFKRLAPFLVLSFIALAAMPRPAAGCTVWAAAGDRTEKGGTILAKNRDQVPEVSELRIFTPTKGLRFFGLFYVAGQKSRPVAGINEKGLALVTITASAAPGAQRLGPGGNLVERILTHFDSVDALVSARDVLPGGHPGFLVAADRSKVAAIEIAPKGGVAIRIEENGILYHTNHYLDSKLLWANEEVGRSSQIRLDRIRDLMTAHRRTFDTETFIRFSADQSAGPDNSIWRAGAGPGRERTVATWIATIPRGDPPAVYVRLANPDGPQRTIEFTLDPSFWTASSKTFVP